METATTTVATELLPSTTVTAKQLETEESRIASTTFRSDVISGKSSETRSLIGHTTETAMPTTVDKSVLANQIEHTCTTAWILFAMMSLLFSASLTINVIVLVFLVYKKRQVGPGEKGQHSEYKIEGNPCYEATEMKQSSTSESETHVYETVREKRAKY